MVGDYGKRGFGFLLLRIEKSSRNLVGVSDEEHCQNVILPWLGLFVEQSAAITKLSGRRPPHPYLLAALVSDKTSFRPFSF